MPLITTTILTSIDECESIREEWRALAESLPWATPFQSPDWLLPWWRNFGSGQLVVVTCRESGRLKAIAPLFLIEWQGKRQFSLVGSGISDYLQPLADPTIETHLWQSIAEYLHRHGQWDLCDFQDLNARQIPAELFSPALCAEMIDDTTCTGISLDGGWPVVEARFSSSLRRSLMRGARDLQKRGVLQTSTVRQYSEQHMQLLFDLHAKQWSQRGEQGMIAGNCSEAFLRSAAKLFGEQGMVRYFILQVDGTTIGVIFGIVMNNALFAYLSGLEPALEEASIGSLLVEHGLRQAVGEGLHRWDFLRGTESYKARWGAEPLLKRRMRVTPARSGFSSETQSSRTLSTAT